MKSNRYNIEICKSDINNYGMIEKNLESSKI